MGPGFRQDDGVNKDDGQQKSGPKPAAIIFPSLPVTQVFLLPTLPVRPGRASSTRALTIIPSYFFLAFLAFFAFFAFFAFLAIVSSHRL